MNELLEMLTYKRPAGSRTERDFIRRYIVPTGARPDAFGNYILRVGESGVAWMCHTDTVHGTDGRQDVRVADNVVTVVPRPMRPTILPMWKRGGCLGADDTTGVWLMLEMIRASVPGLYIFHYGEEIGCIGSNHIVAHTPEVVAGVQYAISLDRKGIGSVITHQIGRRTASDVFAWSLADTLGLGMVPDDGGVFTDSEVYAGIVAECTNLSVGYYNQHTERECQDLIFARDLRDALVAFDEGTLLIDRGPGEDDWDDEPLTAWDVDDPWRGDSDVVDDPWGEVPDANGKYWWET